jgi:TRAP transporter TAXI family solute receptor
MDQPKTIGTGGPVVTEKSSRRTEEQGGRKMKRGFAAALAGIATVAVMFGAASAQQKTISIGTGGTGGVYYPIGGALANLISKNMPGVQATAEVTGGSVDNLKLINSGQSEIGFSMADAALDALNGVDKFKGTKVPLRTLMVLYPNIMHVVTIEGTGVNTLADLKGKRISTGAPGSATEVMAFRVIEAAGLDKDKDMKRERLSVAESVNAIKDHKIDAFFWVGGLPTAGVTDLAATPGTKIKLIDHSDVVAKMNAKYNNLYSTSVIKAGTYPGQDKDNQVSAVWNILVTGDKMTDQEAYDVVKLIIDKKADLVAVHKDAASFSVENQVVANSPIPWHPGAVKFFKEKGAKM